MSAIFTTMPAEPFWNGAVGPYQIYGTVAGGGWAGMATTMHGAAQDHINCYPRFRGQLEHEDTLLDHRMGWLLTSQAIFFGFYAQVSTSTARHQILWRIAALALAVCVATACTIYTGIVALRRVRREFERECVTGLPPAEHAVGLIPNTSPLRGVGLWAPVVLPLLFVGAWIFLLVSPP